MKRHFSPALPLFALSSFAWMPLARADGPAAGSAASPPPDKSACTLFNPTPDSQLRDMDTDRPNVTNTPHTVDAGHLQMETGIADYSCFRDDSPGGFHSSDLGLGQFNFRLGVLDSLEVNAVVDSWEVDRTVGNSGNGTSHASGLGDTTIGGKLNLWGNEGGDAIGYTALAIQPQFKIPTARDDIGNGRFEFSVVAPFLENLPGNFHLGLQPGLSHERNTANTAYVTGLPASVSVDRVVVGNLDVYLEYACDPTAERHLTVPQTIDLGGTCPLGPNTVIDAGVNLGLNHASNNIEILAGISLRR